MKNHIWILLLLAIFSCKTTDGVITPFEAGTGGLIIDSSIKGAKIYINYRDTGEETPARLSDIPAGTHTIHLFLAGYKIVPDSLVVEVMDGEETPVKFDLQELPSVGDLRVNSTPSGALVQIDNLPFGRTPVTVTGLQSGAHHLKIIKGSYEEFEQTVNIKANQQGTVDTQLTLLDRRILLEHFSNVDCPPCPKADEIIEKVLIQMGHDEMSVISYHPDFPGKQDPMFLTAEQENSARYEFYNSPPLPFIVVNGTNSLAGTNNLESRLNEVILEQQDQMPIVTLNFKDLVENFQPGDSIRGRIEVNTLQEIQTTPVVLHIVLIERVVEFPVAPGTNGQKRFTDVMRAFYPSAEGTDVSLVQGNQFFIAFNFQRKAEWKGGLHIVAFLQNRDTHEVLQSIWSVRH